MSPWDTLENFDTVTGKFYARRALPTISPRISQRQKQNDGWGTNLYNDTQLHTGEQEAYRTKWALTPSDATTVTLTGDYSHAVPQVLGLAPINGVFSSVMTGPVHPAASGTRICRTRADSR